ncbi:NUDIX hydrolase [Micromonospora chersina]|uniref:NUDIX hydrolase n=1 Tax=Micromonospora chersina TaxID=47854 RepID=UPI003724C4C9
MPNGERGTYLRIVESRGRPGVAVLPLSSSRVGLVRTFRYSLNEWEWGIPRGFGKVHDVRASALAELSEELGAAPDELVPLGEVAPNSGLLASKVHTFLARYSHMPTRPVDTDEVHAVRWITTHELRSEISSGLIPDAFTLSAVLLATLEGHLTGVF